MIYSKKLILFKEMKKIIFLMVAVMFLTLSCEEDEPVIVVSNPSVNFVLEQVTYEMDMDDPGYFEAYDCETGWIRYNDQFKPLEVEFDWSSPNIEPKVKFTVLDDTTYVEIRILGNYKTKVLAEIRDEYPRGTHELFVNY